MADAKNKSRPANFKKRGGTRFPGVDLSKAEKYAKSLASKTHSAPQDAKIIMKGVFDASGSPGDIRLSACRQFGFVKGANKVLEASPSARELYAATDEQREIILQKAFLTPPIFQKLHTAFQGDIRSMAELKQQAGKFEVHPESLDKCIDCFIASGKHARMITENGDKFEISKIGSFGIDTQENSNGIGEDSANPENELDDEDSQEENNLDSNAGKLDEIPIPNQKPSRRSNSNVAINLDIDSSMDADKLGKMLSLLKESGLI